MLKKDFHQSYTLIVNEIMSIHLKPYFVDQITKIWHTRVKLKKILQ